MAITASIILATKDNVLTVPSSAIVIQNGQTLARILKNNNLMYTPVETGLVASGKTEIISGITEGQEVVTAVTSTSASTQTNGSIFSSLGGGARFAR